MSIQLKSVGKRGLALLNKMRKACDATPNQAITWHTQPFMPVHMEHIGELVKWPLYALSHAGEQNGDPMRDPEVVFWVMDDLCWLPISFRNDYLGMDNLYVEQLEGRGQWRTNYHAQNDLASFCNTWMNNLREQIDFRRQEEVAA